MFPTIIVISLQLLAGVTKAFPAPATAEPIGPCESGGDPTTQSASYANNPDPPIVNGSVIMSAFTCYALDTTCTASVQESHTVGSTITLDTSFGIAIDDVLSAGVDVSVSYSESWAVAEGGQETCPDGDYTCGLGIFPQLAQISGFQTVVDTNACFDSTTSSNTGGGDYAITSPVIDGEGNAAIYIAICACPNYPGGDTAPIALCGADCS